ncbi:MAG: PrsW family intramembrane metalloprotease [Verrucomicrobiales bacterium]|nr:PrsW family intramembrane metalloprotease [Verrucomicrobiales bacterium]
MPYFLLDAQGRPVGPYTREELEFFAQRGVVGQDTLVVLDQVENTVPLEKILSLPAPEGDVASNPGLHPETQNLRDAAYRDREPGGRNASTAGGDFLRLAPHLMLPLEDLVRLRWLDNRRILALAGVGLLPLFLLQYLQTTSDLSGAIWGVALYSSLLWALFFYGMFSQPEVTLLRCVSAYLGSAVFSIGLVALARYIIPFEWVVMWISDQNLATRWAGHLVGVAWIEELAKLFTLYFLWARRPHPRTMMFYGLMAGLGFGIYEGVAYQSSQNLRISFPTGRPTADGAGIYYMLNILRLTSLPFLHAMWTGIAGYFIGFASQYPSRRGGLLLTAITVPSLLHATYNTFSDSPIGLTVAVVTVLALNLYLVKDRDFEAVLNRRRQSSR